MAYICLDLDFKSASSDRLLHIICPRYEKEVTTFNIFPPIVILCALPAFLESMYMTLDFEGLNSMSWLQPYV